MDQPKRPGGACLAVRFLTVGLAFVSLVVPAYVPISQRGVRLAPDPALALTGAVLGGLAFLVAAYAASRDAVAFSRRLQVTFRQVAFGAGGAVAGFFLRLAPRGALPVAVLALFGAAVAVALAVPEEKVPTPEELREQRERMKALREEGEAAVRAAIERGKARPVAPPASAVPRTPAGVATCARCGKAGTPMRSDKRLIVGTFADFADVIMRCPRCGKLYCGSCSLVTHGGSGEYVCADCGEPLGPM